VSELADAIGIGHTARLRLGSNTHHALALWIAGVLQACVLVLTAAAQIYDTNFNTLAETPGLLAGDHPYRDFFDWGVPLQAALSAGMQWLVGYRLIGEFALQWTFIVAGLVMAMRIALRLSNSLVASSICILPAILIFPGVPTVHYTKMFLYPAAILIIWRYIEGPSVQRAAAMGAFAAVAFFFRHDHGVYVGVGVLLGIVLAWLADAGDRRPRAIVRELTACALAAGILLAPWAIVVARSEGLIEYVQARAFINSKWSVRQSVFLQVLHMNPRRVLTPREPGGQGLAAWLPTKTASQDWLMQISVLVVLISLIIGCVGILRAVFKRQPVSIETCRLALASAVVALVASRLFRESGYFALVAALVAALSARLLVSSRMVLLTRTVGGVLLLISTIAVGGFSGVWLNPGDLVQSLPGTVEKLIASPPLDGLELLGDALRTDRTEWLQVADWERVNSGRSSVMLRYMRECTAPGDRILVSGQTPYQVSYYVERPLAGGHLYWHDKWRSDPEREQQSLDLLQHQSVPFAFSTHDPVLDDLKAYPRIRAYMLANYTELEGSVGRLLVDRRRTPVRAFGALGLPCFR
jgi:hypothetical protein